jgi:hypothetical protein
MWEKPTYQFSLKLEHFEILRILAAILKIGALRNCLCVLAINIENSCQNGHHYGGHFGNYLQWPPFLNRICNYHIPQVENLLNINFR